MQGLLVKILSQDLAMQLSRITGMLPSPAFFLTILSGKTKVEIMMSYLQFL